MSPEAKPLRASAHSLGELLTSWRFMVPDYQRPYAWTDEEVEELWDDLRETEDSGGGTFHFFGTLLTIDAPDGTPTSPLEVLDGQQRLATFTLLLIAIDRELEEIEESEETTARIKSRAADARSRVRQLLYQDAESGVLRLELRSHEHAVFINLLSGNPPGRNRLGDAFRALHTHLKQLAEDSSDRTGDIEELIDVILDRSVVIHARCIHGFDPFGVFATLNARGLPLTAAQILRARSLGLATGLPIAVQEQTKVAWDKVEKLQADGNRFLQYYLVARQGSRVQVKSVVREFDAKILKALNKPPIVADFASLATEIDHLADIFRELSAGQWPTPAPQASDWVKGRVKLIVRSLAVRQVLPLLMTVTYRTPDALPSVLETIERATVVSIVCLPNQTRWGDFLFERANQVFNGESGVDELRTAVRLFFLQQLGNPTRALKEALPIQLRYGGRKKSLIRYFLTTLNDYGFPGSGPKLHPAQEAHWDLGQVQIDHISAQAIVDGIPPDDKDRLGNLTPLYGRSNSALGSRPFDSKRQVYEQSPLSMTRALATETGFTIDAINRREKAMVAFAADLFCRDMSV